MATRKTTRQTAMTRPAKGLATRMDRLIKTDKPFALLIARGLGYGLQVLADYAARKTMATTAVHRISAALRDGARAFGRRLETRTSRAAPAKRSG